ncbi:XdhC family protein [Pseudopelagicola sp. nBUS_20]|uniref:XdhC family protein n=1 Tax=Pseudopelagicola sp. nBUS_20 TaxID=3395317 RepID=UPI003EBCE6C8
MADILEGAPELALSWHKAERGAALATVVETWGSAPRRVGAQMVVSGDGQIEGSVSGGCVEGAVMVEALESLENGEGSLLEFGVSDGDAFAVGLACGGTIRVLVEPIGTVLDQTVLQALVDARAGRRAVAYVCDPKIGGGRLFDDGFRDRFRMDRSGIEDDGRFVAIHNPPLRVVIVGAVHIAQALVPLARINGFDPILVDPRSAFGSQERFPGETIIEEWPDEALEEIGMDERTALVLLTHDPKLDDPALHVALKSDVFYIGALGSKRTHAGRRERLLKAGFSEEVISRIHGPVGLDIGAAGPSEIATSIIAEMIQVLRVRS